MDKPKLTLALYVVKYFYDIIFIETRQLHLKFTTKFTYTLYLYNLKLKYKLWLV